MIVASPVKFENGEGHFVYLDECTASIEATGVRICSDRAGRGDMTAASVEALNEAIATASFLDPYGFVVTASHPGECTLRVPFAPALERPGGIVSGLTLMGAADVAMWLAVMTLRGTAEFWVTSDMKTAFLRSARAEDVVCTARILKSGKRVMYGTVESHAAEAGLVAHHVLTYSRVD